MKLLLTGCNGQVGFELQRALAPLGELISVDRSRCDLAQPERVRATVRQYAPDIIVNAAAYTAVDRAESDTETAYAVNTEALHVLGDEAARCGACVIHYSTDYVFDGSKAEPYTEDDELCPVNVYGASKAAGEVALREACAEHLILRTSWVFGVQGANFVKTMLRLATERESLNVVNDQFGAPTSAALIADVTAQIITRLLITRVATAEGQQHPYGTYHLTAGGMASWYDLAAFAIDAARVAGRPLKLPQGALQGIPTSAYPTPAKRPANSRLSTERLRQTFGLQLPDWRHGANHVLTQLLARTP